VKLSRSPRRTSRCCSYLRSLPGRTRLCRSASSLPSRPRDRSSRGRGSARLGSATFLEGNISEAIVRTESILEADPKDAEARLLLSRLYWTEQNRAAAVEQYEQALELNPVLQDPALETELQLNSRANQRTGRSSGQSPASAWSNGSRDDDDETLEKDSTEAEIERPIVGFDEVGGMAAVKEEIRMKIIYPLQNRELFRAYGKRLGGGVLLYGPPSRRTSRFDAEVPRCQQIAQPRHIP
jgi:transitional endoplasmic reticulum ATPase